MKKLFFTLGVALLSATVVSAQNLPKNNFHNPEIGTHDRVTKHGPYLTGKFFDNAFFGVAGGVNIYQYKHQASLKPKVSKRMAPALDIYLGKWVTPSLGFRVGYLGMQAKSLGAIWLDTPDEMRKFKMMYIHGDVLFNLFNAVGGYNPNRVWNMSPYLGTGYARAWDKNKTLNSHKLAASAGLFNTVRLGHRVALTLDGRWMVTDRMFDGIREGSKADKMLSVTAGLNVKLGSRQGFKRPVYVAPVDLAGYENRIKVLEGDVARDRATIDRLNRELEAAKNRPATVETVAAPVEIYTYFAKGKSDVHANELENLKTIADVMKANPDRKFNVTGYADAGTGTKELNQRLSDHRAKNVADVLVTKFGVNRAQLVVSGKGGVTKHSHVPHLDRVVITQ
jgi:outer membrane protein OmpA-like peptidoglycan-associated protein